MKATLKLGFTLAAFAAISCTVLAIVNNFTSPIIAAHAAEKANEGMKIVFAEADNFEKIEDITRGLKKPDEMKNYLSSSTISLDSAYLAKKDDTVIGAVLQVTGSTYDSSTIMVGLDLKRVINGISFLSCSDTPGYGQKALEPTFYEQFNGKDASEQLVVGDNFDAISGATITSNGVADILNFAVFVGGEYLASNCGGTEGKCGIPAAKAKPLSTFTYGEALFDIFAMQEHEELKAEWITDEIKQDVNGLKTGHAFKIVSSNEGKPIAAIVSVKGNTNNHKAEVVVAVDKNRTILGARIITLNDAPHYGLEALDESFYSQFTGKNVDTYFGVGAGIIPPDGGTITANALSNMIQVAAWTGAEWLFEHADGKKAKEGATPFKKVILEGSTYSFADAVFDIFEMDIHSELKTEAINETIELSNKDMKVLSACKILDGKKLNAIAVEVQGPGYSHTSSVALALDTNKSIKGIRITEIHDTPGFGLKALGSSYSEQYVGKKYAGENSIAVDVISGASITSKKIESIVNEAAKEAALLLTASSK